MMNNSDELIKHVVIVGGGTAGWLSANHLAIKLKPKLANGVKITVIESPDIPTIGVGEGTVPMIRRTIHSFGISETDFIRECDVSFKQSIKFIDWTYNPLADKSSNYYHHLFDYPNIQSCDLTAHWLAQGENKQVAYADAVSIQSRIIELGLAPKTITHPEYVGECDYAYHLDAAKFTALLKSNAINNLGVENLIATVEKINVNSQGDICSLNCKNDLVIEADFFVDCSGFSSILLGQTLNVPFIDKNQQLFVDYAVVMQVNHAENNAPLACSTLATAQQAGWIWDIGLPSRRGVGHVYSSQHTSHADAEEALRKYVGSAANGITSRVIPMKIGHRAKFWKNNCVAIGLSQGFVEPLEATGILLFDVTAKMLADNFPVVKSSMHFQSKKFNQTVSYAWGKVIDFIKLHYCLSKRDDTDFWKDNRNPDTIPDSLKEQLELWKFQPPTSYDFFSKHEVFNLDNYLYVLYGMDFPSSLPTDNYLCADKNNANEQTNWLNHNANELTRVLLPHRALLDKIKKYGLKKI